MVDKQVLEDTALNGQEYEMIVDRLGREPNHLELGMFGGLWSEHCGYKHSKGLLGLFPTTGRRVLIEAGVENAGVVDIGGGYRVVMKIESHNHPSAIEPYQGAATGVGGIVRDIFTMGARPIALLNSLRFGSLSEPRNRYLFQGVVGGISSYGNCIGVPDVGGEITFADAYSANPLVNCMCVGLLGKGDRLLTARAEGPGNLLLLVGADTGRDGIHGASGLASRTFEEQRELRSTVQVGNPFLEKVLLEACLEVAQTDSLIGLCDLGAAGLTSTAVESASRMGTGVEIDVSQVPRREEAMDPYEVMLSESQERMLVIVKKGQEKEVREIFQKWDLHCATIGLVTEDGMARVRDGDRIVAEVPVRLLVEPPRYQVRGRKPEGLDRLQEYDLAKLPAPIVSCEDSLLQLLACPNVASKRLVFQQYDQQVQNNTVLLPGSDAALLRIKGTRKGIAVTTDGNGRHCYLDPYAGGAMAVAEAARNVVCVGATPIAITDCLNFGDPEKPEVAWQMEECIKGMAKACRVLNIPVVSGNVSLHNETRGTSVYPTPVVGCLGLLANIEKRCTCGFQEDGDQVWLLGPLGGDLAGSEYLELVHGLVAGRPAIDLDLEKRVQRCLLEAIRQGVVKSAHDCSDGGLAVALAECCILGNSGFTWEGNLGAGVNEVLFGEGPSRIAVSAAATRVQGLLALAARHNIPAQHLGEVAGRRFVLGRHVDLPLDVLRDAYENGLSRALGQS